jgi:hypothetical protein
LKYPEKFQTSFGKREKCNNFSLQINDFDSNLSAIELRPQLSVYPDLQMFSWVRDDRDIKKYCKNLFMEERLRNIGPD